jgi:hypothetical protein
MTTKKLYKYRSLNNIEFVLDILSNERFYCPRVDELNDPFEGVYMSSPPRGIPGTKLYHLSENIRPRLARINDPFDKGTSRRICSLSANPNDVRMWSHYADGHKGILIEVELDENDENLHRIEYVQHLKATSHTILTPLNLMNILTRKSYHWESEQEYRVIHEAEYFNVKGKISSVWLGLRTPRLLRELIQSISPTNTKVYSTTLDGESIEVVIDEELDRVRTSFDKTAY